MDAIRWSLLTSLIVIVVVAILLALRRRFVDFPRCPKCRARVTRQATNCPRCTIALKE